MLITILENFSSEIDASESYLTRNLNPIKTSLMLMYFLERIHESYSITELRIKHVSDFLMKSLRSILKNQYFPTEIKAQVRSKDIFETDAMSYMERQDAYELMDTKIMDRIMKELWFSDIDISGHFLDQSTAYQIMKEPGSE